MVLHILYLVWYQYRYSVLLTQKHVFMADLDQTSLAKIGHSQYVYTYPQRFLCVDKLSVSYEKAR